MDKHVFFFPRFGSVFEAYEVRIYDLKIIWLG